MHASLSVRSDFLGLRFFTSFLVLSTCNAAIALLLNLWYGHMPSYFIQANECSEGSAPAPKLHVNESAMHAVKSASLSFPKKAGQMTVLRSPSGHVVMGKNIRWEGKLCLNAFASACKKCVPSEKYCVSLNKLCILSQKYYVHSQNIYVCSKNISFHSQNNYVNLQNNWVC